MNKKKLISCFVTYFITTTFSLLFFDKGILAEPLDFASDAVLASVDGRAITIYDLNNTDRRINVRNINEFKNRPEAKNALELLILQQLLLSEAERFKISASDNEIEQAVNEMATQNNLSPEQFLKKVGSQGLDPDSLKEQIKIEVIKSKLSTKLFRSSAVINDEEVESILESNPKLKEPGTKVKLRQIFIPFNIGESEALKALEKVQAEIAAGTPFETLAGRFSTLENSSRGGSLGVISEEDLEPQLFDALITVPSGQVSAPIKTSDGISLFKVEERITVNDSLDTLKSMIKKDLTAAKEREKFNDYFSRKIYLDHSIERNY